VDDAEGPPARGARVGGGAPAEPTLAPREAEGHHDEDQREDRRERPVERRAVLQVDDSRQAVELEERDRPEVGQGVQHGEQGAGGDGRQEDGQGDAAEDGQPTVAQQPGRLLHAGVDAEDRGPRGQGHVRERHEGQDERRPEQAADARQALHSDWREQALECAAGSEEGQEREPHHV
jgi:hypothetical protein